MATIGQRTQFPDTCERKCLHSGVNYYQVLFDNLNLTIPKVPPRPTWPKQPCSTAWVPQPMSLLTWFLAISRPRYGCQHDHCLWRCSEWRYTKSPLLTIVTNGTLSASSESNPDGQILVNGSTMQQVAHYKFTATRENFNIDKLTVLNNPIPPCHRRLYCRRDRADFGC